MKKLVLVVGLLQFALLSVCVYGQEFQPDGNRLSLSFVVDDDLFLLVMRDQGVLSMGPRGHRSPPEFEITRTMEFLDAGLLRMERNSGRMQRFLYAKVEEDQILFERELGSYLVLNPDRTWFRAIDDAGESLYFQFYYDSSSALYVHTIRLVSGSTLRSSVYRVVEIEPL